MKKKSLHEEIKQFQKEKKILVPSLLIVGVAGLIMPVIPGLAFIFLALMLIFPKQGKEAVDRFSTKFTSRFK